MKPCITNLIRLPERTRDDAIPIPETLRMKICHVITGLGTGGAQAALHRLVQTLRAPDFEHVVIALGAEGSMSASIAESAELHHLGMRAGRLLPRSEERRVGKECRARV